MQKYNKVLVASNLSQNTGKLIIKAKELVDDPKHITLLHVVPPVDVNFFGLMPYLPIMPIIDKEKIEKHVYHNKNETINAIARTFDLDAEQCLIEKGNPNKHISDFAKSNEFDLIIISTHEQKELGPYIGSTAKRILQSAACDVLAVK